MADFDNLLQIARDFLVGGNKEKYQQILNNTDWNNVERLEAVIPSRKNIGVFVTNMKKIYDTLPPSIRGLLSMERVPLSEEARRGAAYVGTRWPRLFSKTNFDEFGPAAVTKYLMDDVDFPEAVRRIAASGAWERAARPGGVAYQSFNRMSETAEDRLMNKIFDAARTTAGNNAETFKRLYDEYFLKSLGIQ